jgi:hypothetical protein
MSTKNFTQFDAAAPLFPTDYIVGFRADETTELKATLSQVVDLVGANETLQISSVLIRTRPTANIFIGDSTTGNDTVAGEHNFVFGQRAGSALTTGSFNNFLGLSAGSSNTIGSNNTIIGNQANVATNSLSGVIVLGTGAVATESHQIVLSTANVLFRSTGSTFEIGSPILTDNLTVYGNISSTQAIFASGGNSNQWNSTLQQFKPIQLLGKSLLIFYPQLLTTFQLIMYV